MDSLNDVPALINSNLYAQALKILFVNRHPFAYKLFPKLAHDNVAPDLPSTEYPLLLTDEQINALENYIIWQLWSPVLSLSLLTLAGGIAIFFGFAGVFDILFENQALINVILNCCGGLVGIPFLFFTFEGWKVVYKNFHSINYNLWEL
jgi:hypothetical protein